MRYFLIMNPGSNGGKSKKNFDLIQSFFVGADFAYTNTLDAACDLSRQANIDGYDVIIAVGGDGTINRVLNGFYDDEGKRISRAKLGVIYTGTSPDFCKNYNIPLNVERAVRTILTGKTREIGAGKIEFEHGVKYFACCANIGLGADLANNANSGVRKVFGDTLGTFLALIKTLFTYKPIDIEVNGKRINNLYNLSVGKTYYVASGLKIANDLAENDDRFYVLPVCDKLIVNTIKLYRGKPVDIFYADKITVTGSGKVEFDGDEGGELPCVITNAEKISVFCE